MFASDNELLNTLAFLALMLVIGLGIVEYFIYKKAEFVATCLTLAEREFNNLLASGLAHGGRRDRVAERREWNKMAMPVEFPTPGALATPGSAAFGGINYNQAGYRSVAHELIEANEKELGGKGATMGKAAMTAFLLRELYAGNVKAAQIKIIAETRNNADRKPPYVAPGIDILVGFDKFDPQKLEFEKGAGVDKWLLKRVVRDWNFPRDIRWVRTDPSGKKTFYKPMEALAQLYQQNI